MSEEHSLAVARRRYVRDEIDMLQFEREVERILRGARYPLFGPAFQTESISR